MRELQTVRRALGELEYEVTPLPAGKALQVLRRLGKVAGPALGKLGSLDTKSVDLAAIGDALEQLFAGLSDEDVAFINRAFAEQTMVCGEGTQLQLSKSFDLHFQGHLEEWFAWMKLSLEVNFGPLVKGVGASVGARAKAAG